MKNKFQEVRIPIRIPMSISSSRLSEPGKCPGNLIPGLHLIDELSYSASKIIIVKTAALASLGVLAADKVNIMSHYIIFRCCIN